MLRRLDLGRPAGAVHVAACGAAVLLVEVSKAACVDQLEPLTRRHYDDFARCAGCGQVYWKGSHHRRLQEVVDRIVGELATDR